MTIRKLDLSPQIDAAAQALADEQGIRVETFLERRIETEMRGRAQRARLFVRRLLYWWATPVATAAIVLILLEASHGIAATYGRDDLFLALLHWLRVAFVSLFPWPFTILAIITIVLATPYAFGNLLDLIAIFRKVKFAGTEIELNERTKSKLLAATNEIQAAIKEYRERMNHEVTRLVSRHQLPAKLARYSDRVIFSRYDRARVGAGYRCTIHIPDPINDGDLYQVLDYHPVGTGRFRTFSERYGVIGKVWRTEKSLVFKNVDDSPSGAPTEQKLENVMLNWGMSRREAENALRRPSSICLLLEHGGKKVGILYIDTDRPDAFPLLRSAESSLYLQPRLIELYIRHHTCSQCRASRVKAEQSYGSFRAIRIIFGSAAGRAERARRTAV